MLKTPASSLPVAPYKVVPDQSRSRLPDWEDFRVLVTVIRTGSFNRAADALGLTQPTVSRRIAALEDALGVRVIARSTSGAELTIEGRRIFDELVIAHDALDRALNRAEQCNKQVVTLLVSDGLATYWITKFLPALYESHPHLEFRIFTANHSVAAHEGEFDLSLHFLAPSDPDAVAVRLGMLHFLPYASRSYIEQHGRPTSLSDLAQHRLLDFMLYVADAGSWKMKLPDNLGREKTCLFTNSSAVLAESVRGGCGIALLPTYGSVLDDAFTPLDVGLHNETPFWLCYRPRSSSKAGVEIAIRFLRHIFDGKTMPWFSDRYVAPAEFAPFDPERLKAALRLWGPSVSGKKTN